MINGPTTFAVWNTPLPAVVFGRVYREWQLYVDCVEKLRN
jgi:hypothetical protein